MNFLKQVFLFAALLAFVLLVNWSAITFDMMYNEQPLIYSVNQTLHSARDLLNVYLHPQLLDIAIPFFRPSGHFLMYQLLAPVLGWHNTKSFIVVNLIFLALVGFLIIKLYALLFPRFKVGGYIAFGLYLMQPALIVPRLTVMHFEFAYVFFLLLSLYCFVIFCKKNVSQDHTSRQPASFNHLYLLVPTLLFYVLAVTFKEPAIMLGPLLAVYFCISFYHEQFLKNKESREILLLLTAVTVTLAFYIVMPWPTLTHPLRAVTKSGEVLGSINELLKLLLSVPHNFLSSTGLYAPGVVLRHVVIPAVTQYIVWIALSLCLLSTLLISDNKKSVLFLYIGFILFLILPIAWAIAFPWHLSLSLLFLNLVMGFSFELVGSYIFQNKKVLTASAMACALAIGLTTMTVNRVNIQYISQSTGGFFYRLDRNAVLSPPNIKTQLNANSVIVVEDSQKAGDYDLGDSVYPFIVLGNDFNFNKLARQQRSVFFNVQPIYNGTLFRWAYLMPTLHEEVFPFQVANMKEVPTQVIYDWMQHFDNIFCVGYDKNADWHDRTAEFKKNLLLEKNHRHLVVNHYDSVPATGFTDKLAYLGKLPYADVEICQAACDKVNSCKGFTYITEKIHNHTQIKCGFYDTIADTSGKPCELCTSFIKTHRNLAVATVSVRGRGLD